MFLLVRLLDELLAYMALMTDAAARLYAAA